MPLCDFWAEYDAKVEEGRRIKEMTEGKGKAGGFSQAEWAEARRKHAEKMKAKR